MKQNENLCPYCGAAVQQNAAFCLHCMKSLDEKTEIKKKKTAPKRLIVTVAAVVAVCIAVIIAVITLNNKKVTPVCTPEEFTKYAQASAEKLDCNELWQPEKLVQTHFNEKENDSVYHTDCTLSDAGISVIFRNGGEAVDVALCDISENDLESAFNISESALSAAFGYYQVELADMLRDKNAYPRISFEKPFEEYFTDALKRTDKYTALSENGDISTEFFEAITEDGDTLLYFLTKHTENNKILYDLYFEIQ